ncbi:hypothetical protein DPV99_10015 [Aggregatibacter aphrophilus]|jgi:hypothetical protein|uniref:hypothetical protein n=1 Tax=Aggregatibacter kilianii TaxID=2025884 RepID=UPI000DAC599D|nr:hypothetical protein [Aggregatibacter kilianii]RDF00238.1 hypothetical protein DPV99_10015 [Aggregatibacter aphrophilus]
MSKSVFALTALLPFYNDSSLSIVVAVRETKEEVKALYHDYLQQGKMTGIKAINLEYYTLAIMTGNANPPMILATGKKQREIMEDARENFKMLLPHAQIIVAKFADMALIQQRGTLEFTAG